MRLGRKIVSIVTASILLTVVPGTALVSIYAQRSILESQTDALKNDTQRMAAAVSHRFTRSEPKLKALANLLDKELAKPSREGELAALHKLLELNADGVWRNRKNEFDGKEAAGVFLPDSASLSASTMVRHLRIKNVMDSFGAAASEPLENVWYLSPHRSEVIFDRALPQFVFEQQADNDYTQTPWVLETAPQNNPSREFRFTPALFDPVPKVWMVSALLPLYQNGQWIGSLGEDMQLTGVLENLFKAGQLYSGMQHFLLDKRGNFILAGPWQKQLESTPEAFQPDLHLEPELADLLRQRLTTEPRLMGTETTMQGQRYLVIGMQLAPLGLQYFRLTPVAEVLAPTRRLVWVLTAMILLMTLLAGAAIALFVRHGITRRIELLRDVMRGYSTDHSLRVAGKPAGKDELDDVAVVFNDLADEVQRQTVAVTESSNLLRTVIDTAPMRIFWKGPDLRYLGCNAPFARDAGKANPAELIGLDDYAMGWAEQADAYRADDRQVMESGQPRFDFEEPQTTPDGKQLWLRTSKVPLRDANGLVIGVLGLYYDITERKQAEIALLHEKQFSEDSLNALPGVFYMLDAGGRFVRWNHQFNLVSGYSDTELGAMQAPDFFDGEDKRLVGEAMQRVFVQGQASVEADFQTKDGRKLPYHFQGQRSTIGDQTYLLGVGIDISVMRRTQQALETERTHLHTLVNTIPDLIWLKAVDGTYLACNPEFERFFGATEREIVGKTDYDFVPKELADAFRENDRTALTSGQASRNEEWITYASDGHRALLETTKMPMRTPDGRLVGVLGISHDITERDVHQRQLEHIAHFDTLTGLPNRVLLADRLHQALAQAQRHTKVLAVAYVDLDGFKAINDQHGHDVGDRLLTALAAHMKKSLREGDTLARLGGDEFVAILLDLPDVESSAPMLSRLIAAAAEVVFEDGHALRVSASVGVTFYPQEESIDADQLLRQADQAMYQAKLAGKNRYHVFDTALDSSLRIHHESLERIRLALEQREFVLHYQPKVNMHSGQVIGAEALIRWQHPEKGLLAPNAFLPVIEDHPLAVDVGEWVIDTALTQIERWRAAGVDLPVSVNIGARQLQQDDFLHRLKTILAKHPQVDPKNLELEVLETSALGNMEQVSQVIEDCAKIGVQFALDDFGTGYSSLTYLKRLRVALLKIDQSFVRDMLDDTDDLAILQGVIGLARAFKRQVIAEGVETVEHGTALLQLGCELAQGYGIARPMSPEQMPTWAATWQPDAAWRALPLRGGIEQAAEE
jgi:diguanylate cyclase (GGDEF)-like protein/PAS domain S-box-containing protein